MKYDWIERYAIKQLSDTGRALFDVIEREEKGKIRSISKLCSALRIDSQFVLFSCLSGNGKKEELGQDLGKVFERKQMRKVENFCAVLKEAGYRTPLLVIVDDTEPTRVWQWKIPQQEVTLWYQMVIEDYRLKIPPGWKVELWSDIEKAYKNTPQSLPYLFPSFEEIYPEGRFAGSHNHYKLIQHMKKFPNKKLKAGVDIRRVISNRYHQYELQGFILERLPLSQGTILIQTETPWEIKDPLFGSFNQNTFSEIPIIHPFEE